MAYLRISFLLAAIVSFLWVGNNPAPTTQSHTLTGAVESGNTQGENRAPVEFSCSACG